jgi:nucleotide-binding universal stress UspA family protein
MAGIKHIMAATDLSGSSIYALDRGCFVAQSTHAEYSVAHIVNEGALASLRGFLGEKSAAVSASVVDQARSQLLEIVDQMPSDCGKAIKIRVEAGSPADTIPEVCAKENVDLLLLGAHGSGFLHRMVLGSTASRLLRKSKTPVLLVKQEAHREYQRVLIAVDFSKGTRNAIDLAMTIAPKAHFVFLHVFDVPYVGQMRIAGVGEEVIEQHRAKEKATAWLKMQDLTLDCGLPSSKLTSIVLLGEPVRSIIQQEESQRCDLIVMCKHGTNVTEELLLGSVTKRVMSESQADILISVDRV